MIEFTVAFFIFTGVIFYFYWLEQKQKERDLEKRLRKLESVSKSSADEE